MHVYHEQQLAMDGEIKAQTQIKSPQYSRSR